MKEVIMSRPRIVVCGGGTAGALTAHLLESSIEEAEVTLIDSKEYHEMRWAALRARVEPSVADRIVIPHLEYLRTAKLIVGIIKSTTDKEVIMEDGTLHAFDYLVIATGSQPVPSIDFRDRVLFFHKELKRITRASSILVVGGGALGCEFAGEIVTEFPDKAVTIVHLGPRLCDDCFKPRGSELVQKWLESKKVQIILEDEVFVSREQHSSGEGGSFWTASAKQLTADFLFIATGSQPCSTWLQASFEDQLDKSGRVKVDEFLRAEGCSNVFAVGDITNIDEVHTAATSQEAARRCAANIKALVKSVPEASLRFAAGTTAARNAAREQRQHLKPYQTPPDPTIVVSLGRSHGVAQMPPFGTVVSGWVPVMMKSRGLFIEKTRKDLGLTF